MVIVTRRIPQPLHIGQKRFEAYEKAATSALDRYFALKEDA